MPNDPNVVNLLSSYQEESDFYQYGYDSATASIGSSITRDVTRRDVRLDSTTRTWVDTQRTDNDIFSTAPDLRDQYYGEEDRRLSSYENILRPLDRQVYDVNTEINNKKSQILSIYSNAVGSGCTVGIQTSVISGVAIGIGSTVYQDLAQIRQYTNLYDSDSDDPFGDDDQVDLTLNNLSRGYRNVNVDNAGSVVGTYQSVGPWLSIDITQTPTPVCQNYISEIISLALEISQLRIDRQVNISQINQLKETRIDDEISSWVYAREERSVNERRSDITGIITTLSQY